MDRYLVTPEIADELILLGFGEPCIRGLNVDRIVVSSLWGMNFNGMVDYTSLPFYFQVIDWAKETYNIFGYIVPNYFNENKRFSFIIGRVSHTEVAFETPELAYEACVNEIIEYIKMIENERKELSNIGSGEQKDS